MKPIFKVIIAGGRDFTDLKRMTYYMDKMLFSKAQTHEILIVSGKARGADNTGELYAHSRGYEIEPYPANWDKFGKSAGYKRNEEMAKVADALVAFWDGKSKGTKHMIDLAGKYKLGIRTFKY